MAELWGVLISGDQTERDERARTLHRELLELGSESRELGLRDLHSVIERVEQIVLLAHRRQYDVPDELVLTVSMAMEFIGFLVRSVAGQSSPDVDVDGFVAQLEDVLRDAESLPGREANPISQAVPLEPANTAEEYLTHATRVKLSRIATDLYLESIRAEGNSALRLRERWQGLQEELSRLGKVRLRDCLTIPSVVGGDKLVRFTEEIDDAVVSPEVGRVLRCVLLSLLDNAVAHGIELADTRERAGKPREGSVRVAARVDDARAILSIEDDGAGVDLEALSRSASAAGIAVGAEDTRSLLALMFEPGLTHGAGLVAVRDAVRVMNGLVDVRSVRGRGTQLTVTIPDASPNVDVKTFRSPTGNVLLAVESSWLVASAGSAATALDPLEVLGLKGRGKSVARTYPVVFQRDKHSYEVQVPGAPVNAIATRLAPKDPTSPIEVVFIGGAEALLLRLDRIVERMSQSTVPPPGARAPDCARTVSGVHIVDVPRVTEVALPWTPTAIPPPRISSPPPKPQRVLLVDSDLSWLVQTRSALLDRGFAVQVVSSFPDLRARLLKWSPDVVLMDPTSVVETDELDSVYQEVRTLRPLVTLMVFGDDATSRDGVDVLVSKSTNPDHLAAQIRGCGQSALIS